MFSRRLCRVLGRLSSVKPVPYKPIVKPIVSRNIECPVQINSALRERTLNVVYTASSFNTAQIYKHKDLINDTINSAVKIADVSNRIEQPTDIKYVNLTSITSTVKRNYNVKLSNVHIAYIDKRMSDDIHSLLMFISSFLCTMAAVVVVVWGAKIAYMIMAF